MHIDCYYIFIKQNIHNKVKWEENELFYKLRLL